MDLPGRDAVTLVAAAQALSTAHARIPGTSAVAADFYCPLPGCDCRWVLLAVHEGNVQVAAVRYDFSGAEPITGLERGYLQGPEARVWLARVIEHLLATRPQRAVYEGRYLDIKAAAIDESARGHAIVRAVAGLPRLSGHTPPARSSRRIVVPPQRDFAPLATQIVTLRNITETLSGAELLVVAMALSPAAEVTAEQALATLHKAGLPERNPRKLTEKIFQSARDSHGFARPTDDGFRLLPAALLQERLDAIAQRPGIRETLAARTSGKPSGQAPVQAPPKAPAKAPGVTATAPVRTATVSRVQAPGGVPGPSTAAVAGPAVPPAVPPVVPPAVPPAAGFVPAARALPTVSVTELDAVAGRPVATPAEVRLALDAQRLASAAQFDELLALATLRDVTPHRYQTETVRRVLRALRGRAILADEVGLGKTIEALMVLREYQIRGMVRRALVLVPAPLVGQWAGELSQKAGITARTTDDPRVKSDPEGFWSESGVVVASLALARGARHAPWVLASPWDLVVVDEAHHIKNRTTLGYKLVSELKRRFLLLVTATPVENDLEEIYNLVTLLRPGQFATPAAFRKRFIDPKDPTRPRDKVALRGLLAEVMVRNTRAQSGLALPPRFVSTVTVEPTPAEKSLYEAVLAFVRAHHEDASLALAASALLLEAGSSPRAVHATLTRMQARRTGQGAKALRAEIDALATLAEGVGGTSKVDALLHVVATRREPVLVFTRFRETLAEVVAAVEGAGVTAVAFHGGLDEPARARALERFRAGGAVVMVATAAGSEGHNLQSCAVLVNFDLPWNPMAIEQRIGRLHRMGQTREVHVYNLCARGTIEERVLDVLDRRVQLFQLVVGEMDMVLGNIADERDLEDWLVSAVARARTDAEVDATFDRLAEDLLAARGRYESTRALDEALFGKDFEA